jgi:hypothetical protein
MGSLAEEAVDVRAVTWVRVQEMRRKERKFLGICQAVSHENIVSWIAKQRGVQAYFFCSLYTAKFTGTSLPHNSKRSP